MSRTNLGSETKMREMRSLSLFAQAPWRTEACDQCSLFTHSFTQHVLLKVCSVPAVETRAQGAHAWRHLPSLDAQESLTEAISQFNIKRQVWVIQVEKTFFRKAVQKRKTACEMAKAEQ